MKYIPNILTCINLAFGCLALIYIFDDNMHFAAFAIGVAVVFDFADGFFARILNAKSAIGKDLDSLADLVSFGVVPSCVVFMYMIESENMPVLLPNIWLMAMPAFLITIFSALRLAKFNNDISQADSFIGLPTPANAVFFLSFPIVLHYGVMDTPVYFALEVITSNYYNMLLLTILSSALLVSNIPLFSLKFKNFSFRENIIKYVFIIFSLLLIFVLSVHAIPIIVIFYLILSLINNLLG